MLAINETLNPNERLLGHWLEWTNEVMGKLDKIRILPKKRIDVAYIPSEYWSDGKVGGEFWWECAHPASHLEYVTVRHDDSEIATVCDSCGAQKIGEEWVL